MSHLSTRPKAEWAIDSEARVREIIIIIVLVNSNYLVAQENIETKRLSPVKARPKSFFATKTLQIRQALFAT